MRIWLNRIFVFLAIPAIVLAFVAPSVSAASPNIYAQDSGTKIRPLVSSSGLFGLIRSDFETAYQPLIVESNLSEWVPIIWGNYNTAEFVHSYGLVSSLYMEHDNMYGKTVVNGDDIFRIYDRYNFYDDDTNSTLMSYAVFSLDDFGGSWDSYALNRLFYLHGVYDFEVSFNLYAIDDNGGIVSQYYNESGSANGSQSVLYKARLDSYASRLGLQQGEPYYITDWKCVVTPSGSASTFRTIEVSRAGTFFGSLAFNDEPVSLWPFNFGDFGTFLSHATTGDVADLDANSFAGWLAGVATGFFDVPIFGAFSFADVALVLFAVGVVFWLLKIFAGG